MIKHIDHNREIINMMPGRSRIYYSHDTTDPGNEFAARPEFMNTLNSNQIPVHKLELKTNAIVMLIRNLDIKRGHM